MPYIKAQGLLHIFIDTHEYMYMIRHHGQIQYREHPVAVKNLFQGF